MKAQLTSARSKNLLQGAILNLICQIYRRKTRLPRRYHAIKAVIIIWIGTWQMLWHWPLIKLRGKLVRRHHIKEISRWAWIRTSKTNWTLIWLKARMATNHQNLCPRPKKAYSIQAWKVECSHLPWNNMASSIIMGTLVTCKWLGTLWILRR